jgi:glutamine amidotransferase
MCELLAMSARFPTTIRLSFEELSRHGGSTGPHADGWGLGLWEDGDAFVIREPDAASRSQWVRFLQEREPRTAIAIAHVRRATQGARLLRNTQPFARELGGRMHLFAHNGMLPGIERDDRFATERFRRVGDTDSEHAFCALLERLAPLWAFGLPAPLGDRLGVVRAFASALGSLGPANFIYTDGDAIFAHGHRRKHDGGEIRPPGLSILCRTCAASADTTPIAGLQLDPQARQEVALIASVPLSAEHWEPLAEGELVVLREGRVAERVRA